MFRSIFAIAFCTLFVGLGSQADAAPFVQDGSGLVDQQAAEEAPQVDMAKKKLAGIKCVVTGKPAQKDMLVKYKKGEVYFNSKESIAKFVANTAEYRTKANHQLVASGQYVQHACPLTGEPVAKDVSAKVAAIEIGLSCKDCIQQLGKVEQPAVEVIFGDKNFDQSFVKKGSVPFKLAGAKCPMMPDEDVQEDIFVNYRGAKLYFCCKMCKSKFADAQMEYAAQANQQLVQTGQYIQKACPFTGRPVANGETVEIAGTKVGFCCGNCTERVEDAEDDATKVELVFNDKRFKKGFKKNK